MDGWSHRGLIAVALVCMGVSIADAQVKTSRPSDHPRVTIHRGRPTPPPGDSSPARPIASGQRFDQRHDLGRVPGPPQAGGGLTSEGVIPWWPWAGLWPTPIAAIPVDLVPPSTGDGRGGVQLDVQPWRAQVYVDGVYVGVVGDFTGYYRHLELDSGLHVITIVSPPDYDPVTLAVVVPSGDVVTYRGTLSLTEGQ